MKAGLKLLSSITFFFLAATATNAHELILRPQQMNVKAGDNLNFEILSTHQFMKPEEMESSAIVKAAIFQNNQTTPISITENPQANKLQGAVQVGNDQPAYLLAHRQGMVWSQTPEGMKQGTRATLQNVEWSAKYEKFAKTLLNASPSDRTFSTPVGQLLEIVPLTNPATLKSGQDMTVQILYKGQPIAADVMATYDGFTDNPSSYAYLTETASQGQAKIRISAPGTWMVRVQHKDETKSADYDHHMLRSILVFEVK